MSFDRDLFQRTDYRLSYEGYDESGDDVDQDAPEIPAYEGDDGERTDIDDMLCQLVYIPFLFHVTYSIHDKYKKKVPALNTIRLL